MRNWIILLAVISFCGSIPSISYEKTKEIVEEKRKEFANTLSDSCTEIADSTLKRARAYLEKTLVREIFYKWYGTPWDFNGTSQEPGKGKIACGYFVTTTIRDLGFRIPRIKWAQEASEPVIKRICVGVKRFVGKEISDIEKWLKKEGDGVYLAGLDNHIGYIVRKNNVNIFIHASYYKPEIGVLAEPLNADGPFKDSHYRVIGKLFSNGMVTNWLRGTSY